MDARVFRIDDAGRKLVRIFFEDVWEKGTPVIQTKNMQEGTKRRGRIIDKYDVTGNNCTTHSVEAIKKSGSNLFNNGYRSITTQLPQEIEEDFTIPISLQTYLENKASSFLSFLVIEMTSEFKKHFKNIKNESQISMGRSATIQYVAAQSSATGGSVSPYSGGTVGGLLGSTYDDVL